MCPEDVDPESGCRLPLPKREQLVAHAASLSIAGSPGFQKAPTRGPASLVVRCFRRAEHQFNSMAYCRAGSAHYHVDIVAATLRADQPLSPLRHAHLGAIALCHLGRVGLDLVLACLAPHDQLEVSLGGAAGCSWRAG